MAENNSRSANSSIAGYRYQFDLTILEILNSEAHETVTIEGMEDIDKAGDFHPSVIQCKYLSSKSYSLAGIRSSIIPMLDSFKGGVRCRYFVHAHFGQGDVPVPESLSVEELKECLTEKKSGTGETKHHYKVYDERILKDFVNHLRIREGKSIEDQKADVLEALRASMKCGAEEVLSIHYGNALAFVAERASEKDISSRRVTKRDLLNRLNARPYLYTIWHKEVTNTDKFIKETARRLHSMRVLLPSKRRVLYIEESLQMAAEGSVFGLVDLVYFLALDDYGRASLYSARPWTVVVRSDVSWYVKLKRELLQRNVRYFDGYEEIQFNSHMFDRMPTVIRSGRGDGIEETSYDIRLLNEDNFLKYIKDGFDVDFILNSTEVPRVFPESRAKTIDISGLNPENIVNLIAMIK